MACLQEREQELMTDLLVRLLTGNIVPASEALQPLKVYLEGLEDLALDVPAAPVRLHSGLEAESIVRPMRW